MIPITDPDIRLLCDPCPFRSCVLSKILYEQKTARGLSNLWNYAKDLIPIRPWKEYDFDSMQAFYYVDHTPLEYFPRIVPKGPDMSIWEEPNDRAAKFAK